MIISKPNPNSTNSLYIIRNITKTMTDNIHTLIVDSRE